MVSEALCEAIMFDRLHLSGPNQRQLSTGGIKYDGTSVRNWGIVAPGLNETVKLAITAHTNWTDSTDATSSTETTNTIDGTAAVAVAKDGTASTTAYIEQASLTIDLSSAGSDTALIYVFLPHGMLQKLATSGTALEVRFGGNSLTDSDQHQFSVGELVPGWNLLSMVLTAPDATTGSGATLASITTIRLTIEAATSGTTFTGVLWDKFYVTDEGAPTLADSGVTGSTAGTYTHRVTFLTENGLESNAGPASSAITTSGIAASGTLAIVGQPANTETVTLNGKVYTFQTTLTDVDGNVLIGGSATATSNNLKAAVNLEAGGGSTYAASTTLHPTMTASYLLSPNIYFTAKTKGTDGNDLTTAEAAANYSFANATLTGGANTNAIDLSAIPVSPDTQVIARRIYRDISADAVFRFVGQIDDNTTTTYTDDVADASLGSTQPPLAGDALIDNSPPTRFSDCVVWNSRIIGIDADNSTVLYISDINTPEAFRIIDQISLEEELIAVETHQLGLLVYATDKIFLMRGDGVTSPLRLDEVSSQLGTNGFRSVQKVKALNLTVREAEVYLVSDPSDPWLLNGAVLDLWNAFTNSTLADMHIVHDRRRFRIVFFVKTGGTYSVVHIYQYGTGSSGVVSGEGVGVDPQDLRQGVWYTMSLPTSVQPTCSAICERTQDLPELWVGGNDGYVYYLQDDTTEPAPTSWATALTTEAMNAQIEFAAVPLGGGFGGRGEPRYLKINAEASAQTVWTCDITLLSDADGASIATKQFTFTIGAGNTSPIVPIPKIGARGEWCRVKFTNATAAGVGIFRDVALISIPRGDFRGQRAN
jgi:hypothetical protein